MPHIFASYLGELRHLSSPLVVCSDLGVLWITPGIGRGNYRVGENEQCSHPSAALSLHARAGALGDLTIRLAATRSKNVVNYYFLPKLIRNFEFSNWCALITFDLTSERWPKEFSYLAPSVHGFNRCSDVASTRSSRSRTGSAPKMLMLIYRIIQTLILILILGLGAYWGGIYFYLISMRHRLTLLLPQ